MMCRVVQWVYGLALLAAYILLAVGTYGWFGQQKDPLAGVFLAPLGLPWNQIPVPDRFLFALGLVAPLVNVAMLFLLCRWLSVRRQS